MYEVFPSLLTVSTVFVGRQIPKWRWAQGKDKTSWRQGFNELSDSFTTVRVGTTEEPSTYNKLDI